MEFSSKREARRALDAYSEVKNKSRKIGKSDAERLLASCEDDDKCTFRVKFTPAISEGEADYRWTCQEFVAHGQECTKKAQNYSVDDVARTVLAEKPELVPRVDALWQVGKNEEVCKGCATEDKGDPRSTSFVAWLVLF